MPFLPWVPASTAPSGPAGGALNGSYPNPGVAVPLDLQTTLGANPVFGASAPGDTFNRIEMRSNGTLSFGTGSAAPVQILSRIAGPAIGSNAPLDITAAGSGLQVAEGTNAKQGTATLVAGTVTVANTAVTANSRIFLTAQLVSGTAGALGVTARTAGTSFTITSTSATDTSTVAFEMFEPG